MVTTTDVTPTCPVVGRQATRTSAPVLWLGALVALLATVASATGLFSSGGPGERTLTTVRGGTADIYGIGVYRLDTVFSGAGQRGTDLVTLALGVPLLAVCLALYRRGSLRAALLLLGAFAYFLYVYANLALGYAYTSWFLAYVALSAASLFAVILLMRSIDLSGLSAEVLGSLPRRGPAAFMFVSGLVVLVVWLQPIVGALVSGDAPARMDSYTTMPTFALDLAVIAPALFISGVTMLRGRPLGYLVAFPLLGIIMLLGPAIVAQTVSQSGAGIHLSPGEAIGPVVGFLVVCAWAIWVMVSILRKLPRSARGVSPATAEQLAQGD